MKPEQKQANLTPQEDQLIRFREALTPKGADDGVPKLAGAEDPIFQWPSLTGGGRFVGPAVSYSDNATARAYTASEIKR